MPELSLTAPAMFANAARFMDAYHTVLAPLCEQTQLPPAAVTSCCFLRTIPDTTRPRPSAACAG